MIIWIIILALALYFISPYTVYKGDLVTLCRVDPKTFNKWVVYTLPFEIKNWKKTRKVNGLLAIAIILTIGISAKLAMTKDELCDKLDISYHTLKVNTIKAGILSNVAYDKMNKFPPYISEQIERHLEG